MARVLQLLIIVSATLCFVAPSTALAQTQMEMNQQAADNAKAADDALNVVYKKLVELLDEPAKAKLKVSQREWIKFRDAECEFAEDEYRGGSIRPLIYWTCQKRLTEARTAELREHIKSRTEH